MTVILAGRGSSPVIGRDLGRRDTPISLLHKCSNESVSLCEASEGGYFHSIVERIRRSVTAGLIRCSQSGSIHDNLGHG